MAWTAAIGALFRTLGPIIARIGGASAAGGSGGGTFGRGLSGLANLASSFRGFGSLFSGGSGGGGSFGGGITPNTAGTQATTQALGKFKDALKEGQMGLLKFPKIAKELGDTMMAINEPLRRFNGQIAEAYARLERTNIMNEYKTAQQTAGSASALVDAQAELAEEQQVRDSKWRTVGNTIGLIGTKIYTAGLKAGNYLERLVGIEALCNSIEDSLGRDKAAKLPPWPQMMFDLSEGRGKRRLPRIADERK